MAKCSICRTDVGTFQRMFVLGARPKPLYLDIYVRCLESKRRQQRRGGPIAGRPAAGVGR